MLRVAVLVALSVALVTVLCPGAGAQDTISLYGDTGQGLSRFIYTGSEQFDIVVLTNYSVGAQSLQEFAMTELALSIPGIFKVSTTSASGVANSVTGSADTEYVVFYLECLDPGPVESIRITYLDLTEEPVPFDTVVRLRPLESGDAWWPSASIPGEIGYIDCNPPDCSPPNYCEHLLSLEPWSEYGQPDNEELAGAVVLNPGWLPVEAPATTMGALKFRF